MDWLVTKRKSMFPFQPYIFPVAPIHWISNLVSCLVSHLENFNWNKLEAYSEA